MRFCLVYMTLSVIASVLLASAVGASDRPAKSVDEILAAWAKRAEWVKSGEIRWAIPPDSWNRFGRFETEWVPSSGQADREIVGSIQFAKEEARYDGVSFSYADLGLSANGGKTEVAFFRENLYRGFDDPEAEYRDLLAYTVLYSPTKRIHHWHGGAVEYPRALVLPAVRETGSPSLSELTSFNADSANHASGGPSAELHEWLAAPVLLAFRPRLFDEGLSREDACQLVNGARPTYEGRPCRVLHVAATTKKTFVPLSPTERVYWVDPSRDFVVVRCQLFVHGHRKDTARVLTQLDVHYDRVEGCWVPAAWTVMRLAPDPAIVQQVVEAKRTDVSLDRSGEAAPVDFEYAPRTWINDVAQQRQYFVDDDLKRLEIKRVACDYADLLKQFGKEAPGHTLRNTTNRHGFLLGLIRWPGILIPVTVISVALMMLQGARTSRRRPSCDSMSEIEADLSSLLEETPNEHRT